MLTLLQVILPGLWRRCLSQSLATEPWSVSQIDFWPQTDWGWGSGRWAHRSVPSASDSPKKKKKHTEGGSYSETWDDDEMPGRERPLVEPHSTRHGTKTQHSSAHSAATHNLFRQHLQPKTKVVMCDGTKCSTALLAVRLLCSCRTSVCFFQYFIPEPLGSKLQRSSGCVHAHAAIGG